MHLLSISRAQVRLGGILGFYRETRRVLQALPGYPGLLAHDVRLRGLGTTAWTYTLWQDRQSLLDFRNGLAHPRDDARRQHPRGRRLLAVRLPHGLPTARLAGH